MDDWQPGDLALCVVQLADDYFDGLCPITVGAIYTVTEVSEAVDCYGRPGIALRLDRGNRAHPKWRGFNATAFRKIRPLTDEEREEALRELTVPKVPA